MTTINDIQDLVRIMEDRPEWRRELQRVLLTTDMHDTASLITETAKLAAKNAESIAANAEATAANTKSIDRLETTVAETAALVAKNSESIDRLETLVTKNSESIDRLETTVAETAALVAKNSESINMLDASTKRLTETTRIQSGHIGDMRGLFASQKVVREAAIIADRIGLVTVQTLEPQDIIDIWNIGKSKGLTEGISKGDEDSFKNADLVVTARTDDGTSCYIAVEISYTVDERDTTRAIRNAEYITRFTETPTYAAVAGVSKDNRIDELLTDVPQPYSSEQETRVFWSEHEDIAKAN